MSKETISFSEISVDLENYSPDDFPRLRSEVNQRQSNPTQEELREALTASSQQIEDEIKTAVCNVNMIFWIIFGSLFMMLIASTITFGIFAFRNK